MSFEVGVYEIGGHRLIDGGDITDWVVSSAWENGLDATPGTSSKGIVVLKQCDDERLLRIAPWFHELRISLDGDIVFEGPIRYVSAPIDKGMQITAEDMTWWFKKRMIHDLFDWSTGEKVSTMLVYLIVSAMAGMDSRFPDPNLIAFLNVQNIDDKLSWANANLTVGSGTPTVFSQGSLQVHEYKEKLWEKYLSTVVGKICHMSCQGRAVNFWPYGTALQWLPSATVDDFTEFPNLTRNGDEFITYASVEVEQTSLALVGGTGTVEEPSIDAQFTANGFYEGQMIHSGTGLQLPRDILIGNLGPPDGADVEQADLSLTYPTTTVAYTLSELTTGAAITGDVIGIAGGVHPVMPVLVEEFFTESNVIGKTAADVLAQRNLSLSSPWDTLDEDEFKVVIQNDLPWKFSTIVPGYATVVSTNIGTIKLQVSRTGGSWSSSSAGEKVELYCSLKTLEPVVFDSLIPEPFVFPPHEGTVVISTPDGVLISLKNTHIGSGEDTLPAWIPTDPRIANPSRFS